MSRRIFSWRNLSAAAGILLLAACAQNPPATVASNPPPVAPGPTALWYTVDSDTGSYAIDANGQKIVDQVVTFLQRNPAKVATVIGRTDTVGSADYNMHLSHHRADAVRDAIVYSGKISQDRVETRWTGETRQNVPTGDAVAASQNRVVDIAVH